MMIKKETKPIGRSDNKTYEEIQKGSDDRIEVSHSGNCK